MPSKGNKQVKKGQNGRNKKFKNKVVSKKNKSRALQTKVRLVSKALRAGNHAKARKILGVNGAEDVMSKIRQGPLSQLDSSLEEYLEQVMLDMAGKSHINPNSSGYAVKQSQNVPQQKTIDVAVEMDLGALAEAAQIINLMACDLGLFLEDTIDVDGDPMGVRFLASLYLEYNIWRRAKGEKDLLQFTWDKLIILFNLVTVKSVKVRTGYGGKECATYRYQFIVPDKFVGAGGVHTSGVETVIGRHSTISAGWKIGEVEGEDLLYSGNKILTEDQIVEYGSQAFDMVMAKLQGEYGWEWQEVATFKVGLNRPEIFANVISQATDNASPSDGIYGKWSLETPIQPGYEGYCAMGLAVSDRTRRTRYTGQGFLGMHGFFFHAATGDKVHKDNNYILTELELSSVCNFVLATLLRADFQDSGTTKNQNASGKDYQQDIGLSKLANITPGELLRYIIVHLKYMSGVNSWVCAFSKGEGVGVAAGAQFMNFSSLNETMINLELVERLASMNPLVRSAGDHEVDVGRRNVYLCPLIGRYLEVVNNIGVKTLNADQINLVPLLTHLYPDVDDQRSDYSLSGLVGPFARWYVDFRITPGDQLRSATTGPGFVEMFMNVNSMFNSLSGYINVTGAAGGHTSNRSIQPYIRFVKIPDGVSPVDPNGYNNTQLYELDTITSNRPFLPEEINMLNIGIGPSITFDESETSKIEFWFPIFVGNTQLIIDPGRRLDEVYMTYFEWMMAAAQSSVHDRYAAGQQSNSEQYKMMVSNDEGGSAAVFSNEGGGAWHVVGQIGAELLNMIPFVGPILSNLVKGSLGSVSSTAHDELGKYAGAQIPNLGPWLIMNHKEGKINYSLERAHHRRKIEERNEVTEEVDGLIKGKTPLKFKMVAVYED